MVSWFKTKANVIGSNTGPSFVASNQRPSKPIKLLKILGVFQLSCLEFEELPDKIFEDIVYDKPYFIQSAGILNIFTYSS